MPQALIVDDDLNFLLGLAEVVTGEGFTARTARSLADARKELANGAPDIVLIDLNLPDGSGMPCGESSAPGSRKTRNASAPLRRT